MPYIGLDYSLGKSNFDPETGIHFGVISCHSLNPDVIYEAQEMDYGKATCPKCGNPAIDACDAADEYDQLYSHGCADYACDDCRINLDSSDCFPEETLGWSIDDGEYKVIDCLDSDAMIVKSPYYTFAQFCSPCVPGAGSLDNPMPDGVKCYCFGHDWFDGDRAPYPVYSVSTGELVQSC